MSARRQLRGGGRFLYGRGGLLDGCRRILGRCRRLLDWRLLRRRRGLLIRCDGLSPGVGNRRDRLWLRSGRWRRVIRDIRAGHQQADLVRCHFVNRIGVREVASVQDGDSIRDLEDFVEVL